VKIKRPPASANARRWTDAALLQLGHHLGNAQQKMTLIGGGVTFVVGLGFYNWCRSSFSRWRSGISL
jgi:hypothetical protein